MNHDQTVDIIKKISYKPGWILSLTERDAGIFVAWRFSAENATEPGREGLVSGRKWYVSPYSTESEVVQTCLMAALAAEEHECREFFRYRGKRVFNPHISVNSLLSVCDEEEVRK